MGLITEPTAASNNLSKTRYSITPASVRNPTLAEKENSKEEQNHLDPTLIESNKGD